MDEVVDVHPEGESGREDDEDGKQGDRADFLYETEGERGAGEAGESEDCDADEIAGSQVPGAFLPRGGGLVIEEVSH